jgi:hypothetical protein
MADTETHNTQVEDDTIMDLDIREEDGEILKPTRVVVRPRTVNRSTESRNGAEPTTVAPRKRFMFKSVKPKQSGPSRPVIRSRPRTTSIVPFSSGTVIDQDRPYDINGEFQLEFPAAGEFLKMIEYVHGSHYRTSTTGNYYELGPAGLLYVGIDPNRVISNWILIRRENLTVYQYSTPSGKPYRFYMDVTSLKDGLKPFKKDRRLYLRKDANQKMMDKEMMIVSERAKDPADVALVRISVYNEVETFNRPSFDYDVSKPHVVIPTNVFKDACKSITNKKKVKFVIQRNCMIMYKIDDHSEPAMHKFMGNDPSNTDDTVLTESYIPSPIAKNLNKLQAMSPNGVIQVYYEEGQPLLLRLRYNYLGDVHIYIMLDS